MKVSRIPKDSEFGHEMVSEVVEIGKNVQGLKLGDHVFPNLGNALRDRNRMSTVGGFSEYIRIPQCEVGYSVLKAHDLFTVFNLGRQVGISTGRTRALPKTN